MLKRGEYHVPGGAEQVPVAVGDGEDGAHALQVLRGQHDGALLRTRRQGRRGQRCTHRHHLAKKFRED
jgi:hypothetical protein